MGHEWNDDRRMRSTMHKDESALGLERTVFVSSDLVTLFIFITCSSLFCAFFCFSRVSVGYVR